MAIRASLTIDVIIDDDDFSDFSDSFYESIHYEVHHEAGRERWHAFHGDYIVKPIKIETYSHDGSDLFVKNWKHRQELLADNDD